MARRETAPNTVADKLRATLRETLPAARKRAGLTQFDAGRESGIAPEVYGRIERGGMLPSLPTFMRICAALRSDPQTLLTSTSWAASAPPPERHGLRLLANYLPDEPVVRRILRLLAFTTPAHLQLIASMLGALTARPRRSRK